MLSSILVNNSVIVTENRQKIFQLQLSTFENLQLQLQQNRVINCNFVYNNYNFSKPGSQHDPSAVCGLKTNVYEREALEAKRDNSSNAAKL